MNIVCKLSNDPFTSQFVSVTTRHKSAPPKRHHHVNRAPPVLWEKKTTADRSDEATFRDANVLSLYLLHFYLCHELHQPEKSLTGFDKGHRMYKFSTKILFFPSDIPFTVIFLIVRHGMKHHLSKCQYNEQK